MRNGTREREVVGDPLALAVGGGPVVRVHEPDGVIARVLQQPLGEGERMRGVDLVRVIDPVDPRRRVEVREARGPHVGGQPADDVGADHVGAEHHEVAGRRPGHG